MIEIAGAYDENSNDDSVGLDFIVLEWGSWTNINHITTRDLQVILNYKLSTKVFISLTLELLGCFW